MKANCRALKASIIVSSIFLVLIIFDPKFERYLHQQSKAKTIQDISLEEIRRAKEMRDKQNG